MSDLIERLRTEEPMGVLSGCCDTVKLVNPDGPEAADLIEAQQAEIARLREALERAVSDADTAHRMGNSDTSGYSIIRDRARAALEQKP